MFRQVKDPWFPLINNRESLAEIAVAQTHSESFKQGAQEQMKDDAMKLLARMGNRSPKDKFYRAAFTNEEYVQLNKIIEGI